MGQRRGGVSPRPTAWAIAGLALVTALWATNPTADRYRIHLERELRSVASRMDQTMPERERLALEQVVAARGHEMMSTVVGSYTTRYTLGVGSLYVTDVGEVHMVTLGIASRLVPIRGHEHGMLALGRLIFAGEANRSLLVGGQNCGQLTENQEQTGPCADLRDIHRLSLLFTAMPQHFVLTKNRDPYM